MVYPSSLGQFKSASSNMISYVEQTVTNMTMHRILMKKKMTRLIGKENSVAALSVTEIRKLPVYKCGPIACADHHVIFRKSYAE